LDRPSDAKVRDIGLGNPLPNYVDKESEKRKMSDSIPHETKPVTLPLERVRQNVNLLLNELKDGRAVRLTSVGEHFMLVRAEQVVPEIKRQPVFGALKGQIYIGPEFFDPITPDLYGPGELPPPPAYEDFDAQAYLDSIFTPLPVSTQESLWDALLTVFFVIANEGSFSTDERRGLLGCSAEQLAQWEAGSRALGTPEQYARLRLVILVYEELFHYCGSEEKARAMLRRPRTTTETLMQRLAAASNALLDDTRQWLERLVPGSGA
jgi:hypothetical protein